MKTFNQFINENVKNYQYDVISVLISDEEQSKSIQELCFEHGMKWMQGDSKYFSFSLSNCCIDICFPEKEICLNPTLTTDKIGSSNLPYWKSKNLSVDPKIYGKDDFKVIKNIVTYGSDIPTYEPRRINRTL